MGRLIETKFFELKTEHAFSASIKNPWFEI